LLQHCLCCQRKSSWKNSQLLLQKLMKQQPQPLLRPPAMVTVVESGVAREPRWLRSFLCCRKKSRCSSGLLLQQMMQQQQQQQQQRPAVMVLVG
jgi:hypothetical protein